MARWCVACAFVCPARANLWTKTAIEPCNSAHCLHLRFFVFATLRSYSVCMQSIFIVFLTLVRARYIANEPNRRRTTREIEKKGKYRKITVLRLLLCVVCAKCMANVNVDEEEANAIAIIRPQSNLTALCHSHLQHIHNNWKHTNTTSTAHVLCVCIRSALPLPAQAICACSSKL